MKSAAIVTRPGADATWQLAFAEGLKRHGWAVALTADPFDAAGDLFVNWGVRARGAIDRAAQREMEVVILERGYLGDRFYWSSVSFGGQLNGRANFRAGHRFADGARFETHFAHLLLPWVRKPGYALIVGQVNGDAAIARVDIDAWYASTARTLVQLGYEVRFRAHPQERGRKPQPAPVLLGSLADALAGACVVVTFNSNTGVEAALAGVPVVAVDPGSMAWAVASHELGRIVTPGRSQWAHALAWKQFSLEEFRSGFCAEVVGL